MNQTSNENSDQSDDAKVQKKSSSLIGRVITWLITIACFSLIYFRVEKTAEREGLSVIEYISNFFVEADWVTWLMLMIPYSIYFFIIDAHATWRLLRWFNTPELKFTNILPIRASAYILSLVNEQVGKGAMSLYLLKKYDVPVWKALSSMVMLGLVEIYQLLLFSALGVLLYYDLVVQASVNFPLPKIMLSVYAVAFLYFPFHILYFKGHIFKNSKIRDKILDLENENVDLKQNFPDA